MPQAYIDLGSREQPFSLTYVALSRVRRLEDLVLVHCGQKRFEKIKMPDAINEYLDMTGRLVAVTRHNFGQCVIII